MIDVAEGQRLKAAADKVWQEYLGPAETPAASTPEALKEVEAAERAWQRWLHNNIAALLDAAERTEAAEPMRRALAAERELAEEQESLQAGRDLMAVVHGDGGHYREQYGDRKASEDAITIVGALRVAYDDAMHKLSEAQADSERFEWWFNRDVDKRDFMPTYFQGIRERWSLSNWRAAIDAERGKR